VIHTVCTDPRVRPLIPADVPTTVDLVRQLAEYEHLADQCHMTEQQLHTALFGPTPALYGLAADEGTGPDARQVGYALYFLNFSTFEGVHGIYLEDLYVEPAERGTGLGKHLLRTLAATAAHHGFARVEWSVLDWNSPSIEFYRALGAEPMDDWTTFRLTGPALARTAAGTA
jgi:GNAT superfamily N-acetyltransferase